MSTDMIIVFFGELSTKGKNIMDFIRLLGKNIKHALREFGSLEYEIKKDHIYILLNGCDYESVKSKLLKVPGLLSCALAKAVQKDLNSLQEEALKVYLETGKISFKFDTKRIDKTFEIHSDVLNREIGAFILEKAETSRVDVHQPETIIHIMIREESAYVYAKKDSGIGGYPVGIAGKSMLMISGGIDSPVAAYLMMKRGVKLECVHFAAPPYTSQKVIDKIHDLLKVLTDYQPSIKLYIVPFTELEKSIYEIAGPSYCVTIMRRMMLRIAERLAYQHNCLVVSGGESIGQVASQTLHSMKVIEEVGSLPFIRPLATYDKTEIIALAKKIGTYDISIRPFEDCCTIFTLKDPVTHPNSEKVKEIESRLDYQKMILDCVKNVEVQYITDEEEEF